MQDDAHRMIKGRAIDSTQHAQLNSRPNVPKVRASVSMIDRVMKFGAANRRRSSLRMRTTLRSRPPGGALQLVPHRDR